MRRKQKAKQTRTTAKKNTDSNLQNKKHQVKTVIGVFILLFGVFLLASFISFFYTWQQDQSILTNFTDKQMIAYNHLGKIGAQLSHFFVYQGFGLPAFIIPFLILFIGYAFLVKFSFQKVIKNLNWSLLGMVWLSISASFVAYSQPLFAGIVGFELNNYLQIFLGKAGLGLLLVFGYITYVVFHFQISPEHIKNAIQKIKFSKFNFKSSKEKRGISNEINNISNTHTLLNQASDIALSVEKNLEPTIQNYSIPHTVEKISEDEVWNGQASTKNEEPTVAIDIEAAVEETATDENLSNKLVEDFGEFDPTLELSNFKFPPLTLLKEYNETISIDEAELESNKDKIVESLKSYKIQIAQIKATVGPTVTLYEIVPAAGVRVSKIKNLEDDIALSLAALGIRIIAPIPGKGTIGIEVPNSRPTLVSMRSVIAATKFQESNMELPIALGKTISNETFVFDLAKMPHLLMAGATGQGKSVGLNAVLTSLLYKKHPAEVKLVLVDPKKVELTLFNKIERHYLAKLPDSEEAIITDTKKVVNTLNSLCLEMDERYELLKTAFVRNIKEYNTKFKARKLSPENGHRFLPYIVLVIDEFADLIMTAGKEVEMPIARLAQLARAIGIHLIVATQRPSVNVITGLIKANFPTRIAFRVTSKIDSRTILDASGADQLIGKGDLLYSGGSDVVRIQCSFIDTPEVEKITEFIGSQRAYSEAYLLPEYQSEEDGMTIDVSSVEDRDPLFEEAAKLIVNAQQGSTSLIQRKLKLGYNRAGRIVDQLEAAGIIGPFEGSKARQVLITDILALEQLLENEIIN